MSSTKKAVLSLSGGMDSSTLLLHLLANGYEVTALGFDYGQKHRVELERATSLVEYINNNTSRIYYDQNLNENAEKYIKVKHQIIKLDGLQNLLHSSLVTDGDDVPEGHYEQDNMKETVVPNRNKIFSSLIQAVALSIATKSVATKESLDDVYKRYVEEYKREWSNKLPPEQLEGSWLDINEFENLIKTVPEFAKTWGDDQEVVIAMGIHAGDHAIYPDCRQEFRDADFEAFKLGNWDSELVSVYTPYLENTKFDIIVDGLECCGLLGLDFGEVYKRTNTSYKPIFIPTEGEIQNDRILGKWYSDYKSASSVERIEAFIKLNLKDPVEYADETGPVSWEVAKSHVEKVLAEYAG
jgi:7-cyano-7-deazaguanine synthase in queuosine biosynthesis